MGGVEGGVTIGEGVAVNVLPVSVDELMPDDELVLVLPSVVLRLLRVLTLLVGKVGPEGRLSSDGGTFE